MAKSRGRKFAEITSPASGVLDAASVPTITNAKLQNSAMTLAGSSVSLGGTGVANTDALSEGSSNLYFTNTRVQTFLGGGALAGNIVVPDNRSIYLGSDSDLRLYHNGTNGFIINSTGELRFTGSNFAFKSDSAKLYFGVDDDLQIYHDGFSSYIKDAGTGHLRILATDLHLRNSADNGYFAHFDDGGAATLYHNGSPKFATASGGVSVTGAITSSDDITAVAGGNSSILTNLGSLELIRAGSNAFIDFKTTTSEDYDCRIQQASDGLILVTGGQGSTATALTLNSSQNATFAGSITATGLIVNANTLTLNGTDPLINLQNGGSNHWQIGFENTQSDRFVIYDSNASSYRLIINSGGNTTFAGTISSGAITSTGVITTSANSAAAGVNIKRANAGSGGAKGFLAFRDVNDKATASIYSIASGGDNNGDLRFATSNSENESTPYNLTTALTLDKDQNATFAGDVTVSSSGSTALTLSGNFPRLYFVDTAGSDLDAYIVNNANGLFFGKTNSPTASNDIMMLDLTNQNVGIGTTPDSDVKLHIKGDGARIYVDSADYNLVSLGRRGSSGTDLDKAYLRMKNGGTNTVVIDTDGNSYFNGGNVGIGTTPESNFHVRKTAVSSKHVDSFATSIVEDTESRLQLISANTGDNASALLLTNVNKHWIMHHHGPDGNNTFSIGYHQSSSSGADFVNSSSDALNITTSGAVGIGMNAVQALDIERTTGLSLRFYNSGTFKAGMQAVDTGGQMVATSAANDFGIRSQSNILFASGGNTERMRIQSGGNILIGKISTAQTTAGSVLYSNGQIYSSVSGGQAQLLTRLSNDGIIQLFYKDSGEIGRIGTINGQLTIGNDTAGIIFNKDSGTGAIYPWNTGYNNTGGAGSSGALDLGADSRRWKDFYLSGNVKVASGKGIDFSATTDGVSTANRSEVFDDYEEGTWSPTVYVGSTQQSIYVHRSTYVKIGDLVHCTFSFYASNSNFGSSGGNVELRGFPFASSSTAEESCGSLMMNLANWNGASHTWYVIYKYSGEANDGALFYGNGDNVGWDALGANQVPQNTSFIGTITFRVFT